jgi:hypothetical protein
VHAVPLDFPVQLFPLPTPELALEVPQEIPFPTCEAEIQHHVAGSIVHISPALDPPPQRAPFAAAQPSAYPATDEAELSIGYPAKEFFGFTRKLTPKTKKPNKKILKNLFTIFLF